MMDGRMDGFTIGYWCCHCFQDCSIPKKAKKEIICYQSDGAKVVHPLLKLLDYPSKIILMYFKIYLLHEWQIWDMCNEHFKCRFTTKLPFLPDHFVVIWSAHWVLEPLWVGFLALEEFWAFPLSWSELASASTQGVRALMAGCFQLGQHSFAL